MWDNEREKETYTRGTRALCSLVVATAFRELIETRHLYQAADIEKMAKQRLDEAFKKIPGGYHKDLEQLAAEELRKPWAEPTPKEKRQPVRNADAYQMWLHFDLETANLYCDGDCHRVQAFRLLSSSDVTSESSLLGANTGLWEPIQLFGLFLRCQACLKETAGFLIQRNGWKVTLCGRSPMEGIETPSFVPKRVRSYYGDAVIARNCNKVLAAVFYLRTLVEQYARLEVGNADLRADELLSAYMSRLPNDFKSRFPSLEQIYSNLSAAVHAADENPEVFEAALAKLTQHLKARELIALLPAP